MAYNLKHLTKSMEHEHSKKDCNGDLVTIFNDLFLWKRLFLENVARIKITLLPQLSIYKWKKSS